MKFYKCEGCGKIAVLFRESACPTKCCGEPMVEVVPGTVDAAREKHIPDVAVEGNLVKVKVGSVEHPMLDAHYIEWIILETNQGFQKKDLKPGQAPVAVFALAEGETPIAAYESCNLHGIWKADI
ncbi:MAG: desulfoferrodoxin Dfx [Stomatobaculum sp.]|nr:desulfoferrodoxin Dfx [Stomatobaculum sp.]